MPKIGNKCNLTKTITKTGLAYWFGIRNVTITISIHCQKSNGYPVQSWTGWTDWTDQSKLGLVTHTLIVPHMQFEGMRDMYNLYSIPNLNKTNIGLFRSPKFCEIGSHNWVFKIIQYLDFDCGQFRFENMYNESYYFFLHSNYFAYAFWATVAYVVQGAPCKNDNLVSHGIWRMVVDSPRDETYLDE